MNHFDYVVASSAAEASSAVGAHGKLIAGGTNILDLMKENLLRPERLVDVSRLPHAAIEETAEGGLLLGATARNAETAHDPRVMKNFPVLSAAILAGASPQIRNMATDGGNLLQRTRCYYFYDAGTPCNKRSPGAGCSAIGGLTRHHAILGASEHCIATHPSDMCVALRALDAVVRVQSASGKRSIPFADFHRLPGDTPHLDTNLAADEVITGIALPPNALRDHSTYFKVRDRASYAFALVSVAAGLALEGGLIRDARVALGGVAHKPWRDEDAERMLVGQAPKAETFTAFARKLLLGAQAQRDNGFKIPLAERAVVRALTMATSGKLTNTGELK